MRQSLFIFVLILTFSCTKKEGVSLLYQSKDTTGIKPQPCLVNGNSIITYSNSVKEIMKNHCYGTDNGCHSSPGSGGINLDNYSQTKATAESGQLLPVVIYVQGNTFMPPENSKFLPLDSCEIKTLTLWIKQGCPLN